MLSDIRITINVSRLFYNIKHRKKKCSFAPLIPWTKTKCFICFQGEQHTIGEKWSLIPPHEELNVIHRKVKRSLEKNLWSWQPFFFFCFQSCSKTLEHSHSTVSVCVRACMRARTPPNNSNFYITIDYWHRLILTYSTRPLCILNTVWGNL